MMIENIINSKPFVCTICGLKVKDFYKIIANKKDLNICGGCLNNLYKEIGQTLTPKSPASVLKVEKIIKEEDF